MVPRFEGLYFNKLDLTWSFISQKAFQINICDHGMSLRKFLSNDFNLNYFKLDTSS